MRLWVLVGLVSFSVVGRISGQDVGWFASRAEPVTLGESSVRSQGRMPIRVMAIGVDRDNATDAKLRVQVGGKVIERDFQFGLNAEVLWAPTRNRFAITGSEGGANGQYQTAVVTVSTSGLQWFDVTPIIERAFGHPVRCGWPEAPNVGALTWLSETRLVTVGEIINHSNCDSFGTFVAFEVDIPSRRVIGGSGQLEAKRRWGPELGVELRDAPDGCIKEPSQCYVATNHPESVRK